MRWIGISALAAAALAIGPAPALAGLAFPGAQGFGAEAKGGRGGDVYHVTSLDDAGPGSLRYGIDTADGPRTIVFEVGGKIVLASPITIRDPYLTIAGQTAPGGIGLQGYPLGVSDTHDIVLRYLRVRTGDYNAQGIPGRPAQGNGDLSGDAADGLSVVSSDSVIIDHVSAAWSMDETLSVTKSTEVTVQHSLISESLNDSFHPEGRHGFGSLVRGRGRRGFSFVGNLWAHHTNRSPGFGGEQDPLPGEPREGLDLDIVNNVIYDWRVLASHNVEGVGLLRVHYVGNVVIIGSSTACDRCVLVFVDEVEGDDFRVYQAGNLFDGDRDGAYNPVPLSPALQFWGPLTLVDLPFAFLRRELEPLPADRAYDRVIREAGASLVRDEVDQRVIRQLVEQSGEIIDSQEEVGGWPPDPPSRPPVPADEDRDGMADSWECLRGLDPGEPEDRNDHGLSVAYTNLEVYLNSLVDPDSAPATVHKRGPAAVRERRRFAPSLARFIRRLRQQSLGGNPLCLGE